jgi:hypothetical protein
LPANAAGQATFLLNLKATHAMVTLPANSFPPGRGRGERETDGEGEQARQFTRTAMTLPPDGISPQTSFIQPVSQKRKKPHTVVIAGFYNGLHNGTIDEYNAFTGRAGQIADKTDKPYVAHTGKQIIESLETASAKGPITKLVVLSHGNNDGVYMDPDNGLYSAGYSSPTLPESRRIDDIIDGVKHGRIKIADNATIVFTMCDGGKDHQNGSVIEELSKKLSEAGVKGVKVYGALGKASPKPNGKRDSNNYQANNWYVAVDGQKTPLNTTILNPATLK